MLKRISQTINAGVYQGPIFDTRPDAIRWALDLGDRVFVGAATVRLGQFGSLYELQHSHSGQPACFWALIEEYQT